MSEANDKELAVFGFSKGMRAGLVTFIMSLQTVCITYLFFAYSKSEDQKQQLQARLYEQMIEYMKPARDKINSTADRVDTAAIKAIKASDKVDSVSTYLLTRKTKKK